MLIVAGEPGGSVPGTRAQLEQVWEARVIDHWGMTEIGSLGAEAEDRPGGLYILETECIAEILHPGSHAQVAAGEAGELVITNLGRWGSPLFRYRTGDIVRSSAGSDPTGRALLWLEGGILGRTDDMLIVRGNNVFPSSIESIVREIPEVAEFRIEVRQVRAMPELTVVIEPAASTADPASLNHHVQTQLQQRLGFAVQTRLTDAPMERFELKSRRVVRVD
jgi:phenylacetate-CoA ligase